MGFKVFCVVMMSSLSGHRGSGLLSSLRERDWVQHKYKPNKLSTYFTAVHKREFLSSTLHGSGMFISTHFSTTAELCCVFVLCRHRRTSVSNFTAGSYPVDPYGFTGMDQGY